MRNIKTITLKSSKEIIEIAKKVIQKQSEAIAHLSVFNSQFSEPVTAVYQSPGRPVFEDEGAYIGMVYLHDIIKEGIL